MSILPASTDYTDKDFDSLRSRLFDLIQSVYPNWSVTAVANFGNILVESFGFIGDVLTFYQDQQAREGRIATAELRKNMIALVKLVGYELRPAAAASADVTLTITNANELTGVVSPESTALSVVLRTNEITNPVRGELDSPVTFDLTSGETEKDFTWRNAVTRPTYIVASTGNPDQVLYAPYTPFLGDDSEVVSTTVDGAFTKVDSFLESGPADLHYRRQIDQNDRAAFIFGDNRNGKIPTGDIQIQYKTGGGVDGNVDLGSLVTVETSFYDSTGRRAYLSSTNQAAATGGVAREEVDAARINAPASLRVLNRTVSREDYEINARRVDGVGRALMLTSNEDTTVQENRGKLYVIPSTGGTPSQSLLDSVMTMCTVTYPNTITFQLEVLAAAYKTVDIIAMVWLHENYVASTVKASIEAALQTFFTPMDSDGAPNESIDFGYNYQDAQGLPAGEIAWSDVFNVIRDQAGVRKLDQSMKLNDAVDDVSIFNWEFPALGTVTIINGDTGTAI